MHLAAVRHRPLDGLRPDPEALCAGLVGAGDCEAALGPLLCSPGQLGEELVQERRLAHSGAAADGDDRDGAMQLFQNVDGLRGDRELLRGRIEADELSGHSGVYQSQGISDQSNGSIEEATGDRQLKNGLAVTCIELL